MYILYQIAILSFFLVPKELKYYVKGTKLDTDFEYLVDSVANLVYATLSIFIVRYIIERHRQQTFKPLGLQPNAKTLPDLFFGFLLSGILISFIYIVGLTFGWVHFERFVWETVSIFDIVKRCSMWLLTFVMVGVWEELVARGYWLHTIENNLNLPLGVIISSVLFTVSHLILSNATWRIAVTVFLIALLLAYSKIRTTQLWLPIGFHIGWNFFLATIFGFSVSGINRFSLIQNTISGSEWLLGGKFGLEDGLLILTVVPLGGIAVHLWTQNRARSV